MRFYLISPPFEDENFNKDNFDKITDIITIDYFQIRPKHNSYFKKTEFAKKFLDEFKIICEEKKINFLLNDDVYLSKKLGYDGVHLGQNDMNCKDARKILGEKSQVGISCNNSFQKAEQALKESANYVAFGPAFNSKTKKSSKNLLNLELFKKKKIKIPFTIIGGIDHTNIKKLLNIGAMNFSLINSIWGFKYGPIESALKFKEIRENNEN